MLSKVYVGRLQRKVLTGDQGLGGKLHGGERKWLDFFHLHQMAGCSGSTGVLLFICGADTIECLYCARRVFLVWFRGVPATKWNDVMSMVSSILKRYIG